MRAFGELLFVLTVGLLLAWFGSATPRALPASAPADRFAAGRALRDIAELAQVPHPLGSAADARVRAALVGKLAALQLSPQTRAFAGVRAWDEPADPLTYRGANILARVAGLKGTLPAILVMSHYDSVARSPGAADDMAGVATALEMARLLRLHQPERDVLFAFTDGEEAGLVGAGALLSDPAVVRSVGVVVNMDVRGGGGRALMFQTGRGSGGLQRLYAAEGRRPAGNSLAAYLYQTLPNDTDFTVALAHGLTGLNYAFIGRPALYHTAAATPAAVEPGAVQSLGEQSWAVVRTLARSPVLPAASPDLTWFDLLGRWVVIYPPAFGWVPLVGGAGLLLLAVTRRRAGGGLRIAALPVGAAQALGATLLAAGLLHAYGVLGLHGYYTALGDSVQTEWVIAAVCLGSALLLFRLPTVDAVGRWAGAVTVSWAIALVLQATAPRTAFLAEWPTLLATVALSGATLGAPGWVQRAVSLGCAGLTLGFLFEIEHMLVLGVGLTLPAAGAAVMPFALAVLAPFLQAAGGALRTRPLGGVASH